MGPPQTSGVSHVYGVLETAPPKPEAHLYGVLEQNAVPVYSSLTRMAVGDGGSKPQQHDYTSLNVAA